MPTTATVDPWARTDERVAKTLAKALDDFAREKGVGPDLATRDALVAKLVQAVRPHLRFPSSGQVLLLDVVSTVVDDKGGERHRYHNPRIEDANGRDFEEIMTPCDEHTGEPIEGAGCAFVYPLPNLDAVPEI